MWNQCYPLSFQKLPNCMSPLTSFKHLDFVVTNNNCICNKKIQACSFSRWQIVRWEPDGFKNRSNGSVENQKGAIVQKCMGIVAFWLSVWLTRCQIILFILHIPWSHSELIATCLRVRNVHLAILEMFQTKVFSWRIMLID